jgi:murein L,D-transpeptidase YafK
VSLKSNEKFINGLVLNSSMNTYVKAAFIAASMFVAQEAMGLEGIVDSRYNYSTQNLTRFQEMKKNGIKPKGASIIVDKADYKLDLYIDGKLKKSFPIELGHNPYADKLQQGDMATPEGMYKVKRVRDKGNTSFYRALAINYPNRADRRRFNKLKRTKKLPRKARIGGAIEIHGKGAGRNPNEGGQNWTLGCMALSNSQMDELFKYVKQGTPVTIIKYDERPLVVDNLTSLSRLSRSLEYNLSLLNSNEDNLKKYLPNTNR